MSKPLLEVADVEAGYGEALVLRGVSLTAFEAELVAIIGPNGAGKSTLLKVIYGLLRPTSGQVRYRTDDVTGVRPERLTRLGLNYVPQLGNVFPSLSIAENLLVGSVSLSRTNGGRPWTTCTRSFHCSQSGAANGRARSRAASASCSRSRAHS